MSLAKLLDPSTRSAALWELFESRSSSEFDVVVSSDAALDVIAASLLSKDVGVAWQLVLQLASGSKESAKRVAQHETLMTNLVSWLLSSKDDMAFLAAGWIIDADEACKASFVAAGAIAACTSRMTGDSGQASKAAILLEKIASGDSPFKAAVMLALTSLLPLRTRGQAAIAAQAMQSIVSRNASCRLECVSAGAVPALVPLLSSVKNHESRTAAQVLATLMGGDATCLLDAGLMPCLCSVLARDWALRSPHLVKGLLRVMIKQQASIIMRIATELRTQLDSQTSPRGAAMVVALFARLHKVCSDACVAVGLVPRLAQLCVTKNCPGPWDALRSLGAVGRRAMLHTLRRASSVRSLVVRGSELTSTRTDLTDADAASIAAALGGRLSLGRLAVHSTRLTDEGVTALLGACGSSLRSLRVTGCQLGSKGLAIITSTMERCRDLQELTLGPCGSLPSQMISVIGQHPSLMHLTLPGRDLTVDEIMVLTRSSRSLRQVDLISYHLSRTDADRLAQAIRANKLVCLTGYCRNNDAVEAASWVNASRERQRRHRRAIVERWYRVLRGPLML